MLAFCDHAANTQPLVDTGCAASPLPAFGSCVTFLLPKSTMAMPRGVETATQPVCLPSVDGACNVA